MSENIHQSDFNGKWDPHTKCPPAVVEGKKLYHWAINIECKQDKRCSILSKIYALK